MSQKDKNRQRGTRGGSSAGERHNCSSKSFHTRAHNSADFLVLLALNSIAKNNRRQCGSLFFAWRFLHNTQGNGCTMHKMMLTHSVEGIQLDRLLALHLQLATIFRKNWPAKRINQDRISRGRRVRACGRNSCRCRIPNSHELRVDVRHCRPGTSGLQSCSMNPVAQAVL